MNRYFTYMTYTFDLPSAATHVIFTHGETTRIKEPFYDQKTEFTYDEEGLEHVLSIGDPYLCVRYTPTQAGECQMTVFADRTVLSQTTFSVLPSDDAYGYVTVNPKDRRYFTYTDGRDFLPIGVNLCYPTKYPVPAEEEFSVSGGSAYLGLRQYEAWFRKLSENGVNLARLWLGHTYFNPFAEKAGDYDLTQFSKIDAVIDLARKYGLKLKLTLEQFRFFDYITVADGGTYTDYIFHLFNRRLYASGKRCETMSEFLTDPFWESVWLDKVKEYAKRYSDDPTVFAIELWNEMNCISQTNNEEIRNWNRRVLPKVQALFPQHMVTNSLGSFHQEEWAYDWYQNFTWGQASFRQMHAYLDQGEAEEAYADPLTFFPRDLPFLCSGTQPTLIAETGAVNPHHSGPFKFYSADDDGLIFADCVYTPFFCGCAGCGHLWHWDERYLESKNLYAMYRPFADLCRDIDLSKEDFQPKQCVNEQTYAFLLEGKTMILGYLRNRQANWKQLLRDLKAVTPTNFLWKDAPEGELTILPIWESTVIAEKTPEGIAFSGVEKGCFFRLQKKGDSK